MDLSGLAIRQPVTVAVGVILIVMTGLIALGRIPVQLTPNVEQTIIKVTTRWEGASPQEVEQEIIDPQEEKLQGIANVIDITSKSQQGQGDIRLEFAVGTSKEQALREVSDKLREIPDYPENVDEPVVSDSDPESRDYIAWIVFYSTDPDFDVLTLFDFAEDRIKAVLERVPGVSEVNVLGGREREVQVRYDPVRLAERGLTVTDLVAAIRNTNRNVSAGMLEDGKADIRVRTVSQYEAVDQVEGTVLRETDAGPVYLRDVAEVVETYKELFAFVRHKGKPVMAINADKEVGANVMEVMDGLKAAMVRLNEPGGVLDAESKLLGLKGKLELKMVYDQTVYIHDALDLVYTNIWLGGGLAMLVLLLFLRSLRTAGLIAMAIPICIMGSITVMVALGRTINVISLAGMAFAVGMVVDNAIVVLENIYRHLEMGKPPYQAASDAAREVWGAVLASTLTTIVVFIPILLIQEEAGQLFRDIAFAICAAVALSLIVSITVIPSAAARFLKPFDRTRRPDLLTRVLNLIFFPLVAPFRGFPELMGRFTHWICGSVMARLAVVIVLTGLSVVGTYFLIPPSDYLPVGNRNMVIGLMFPPPGYNIQQQSILGRRIEDTIQPFWEAGRLPAGSPERKAAEARLPEVPTFDWMKQAPGAPVVPPPISEYFLVAWANTIFHGAISDDPHRVVDLIPLVSHAGRPEVAPGTIAFGFQVPLFRLGGSSGSAVKVNFVGQDLEEVKAAAQVFFLKLMQAFPGARIEPDPSNFNIPSPELQVIPDRLRLAEAGLTPMDLGLAVQAAGDGAIVGEYRIAGQNIDLKVISRDAVDRKNLGAFGDLPVATRAGKVLPLTALAALNPVPAPQQINRVSRLRAVTLQFTAPQGLALEDAVNRIKQLIQEGRAAGEIPASVETSYTGSASKLAAVQAALLGDGTLLGTLSSALVLALIVTYLLLCVLFQSFLRPLVIIFSVPLATLGGFAGLFVVFIVSVTDRYLPMQMLDVLTMLGFVLLIGVVVNNAILLVHQSINFMRGLADTGEGKRRKLPPREAIAEAVRTRVRPIFMSTFTSVGGMLPLVVMPGAGSELYRGLGSVVVGGLLVSTIFTLFLVPSLFSLVTSAQERLGFLGRHWKRDTELRAAGIGTASSVALLVAAAGLLSGCSLFRAERDPDAVERMIRRMVETETLVADREPGVWKPPAVGRDLDRALAPRLAELEKMAGPGSFQGRTAELGVDLHGKPQKSTCIGRAAAVEASVKNNLGVQLARIDPAVAAQDVRRAHGEFDPVLFATVDWARLREPNRVPVLSGIPLGVARTGSERGAFSAGIRQRMLSGATVTVDTLLERLENQTRGIDFSPDPAWTNRTGLTVSQPLLKGRGATVNRADIHLAENERDRAEQRLKGEMLRVIATTESAYWDLVLARRTLLIQQRLVEEGRKVRDVLEARQTFDARQAEYSDAVATVKQREASLIRARRLVKMASDQLKAVMYDPAFPLEGEVLLEPEPFIDAEPMIIRLGPAIRTAVCERPEVREAVLSIDDADVRQKVARNFLMPTLDLSGSVYLAGMDRTFDDSLETTSKDGFADYLVGLAFEFPLGNRTARADRERARLERDRAAIALKRVVTDVILDVKIALREVQTTWELIGATRTSRLAATENLRALLVEEQENRKLTPEFLNLKFERQNRLASAQLQEAAALADYQRALAEYHRALGILRVGRKAP